TLRTAESKPAKASREQSSVNRDRSPFVAALILAGAAIAAGIYFGLRLLKPKYVPTRRDFIGQVTILAGSGSPGATDGRGRQASFDDPFGIAVDRNGTIYVSDGGQNNRIRKISPDGVVHTIAGSEEGYRDGPPLEARFNTPSGIALDRKGNLYVADSANNRIREISAGRVTTIAGNGQRGHREGAPDQAEFDAPVGIAVDSSGNVYVADTYNDCVRLVSPGGAVTTLAGSGKPGLKDGSGAEAMFDTPVGVVADATGNLFVADTGNNAIRKIDPEHMVTTFVGGTRGHKDGHGTEASFDHPVGLTLTHDGFLFVTDEGSGTVRLVTPEGEVRTVAGQALGFADGLGAEARFNSPSGAAIDSKGELFVTDTDNYLVRKITAATIGRTSASDQGKENAAAESNLYVQPRPGNADRDRREHLPDLGPVIPSKDRPFPWPLEPQNQWHEIAGVVGEARGAAGGIALDHLHSGLDVRGAMGQAAHSVLDEKTSSPIPNWGFGGQSEGIHVKLMSYIHVRIGRDSSGKVLDEDKFKPRIDDAGNVAGVRVRRGARFRVGDVLGTLNQLNHVHLNCGPTNAQINPIQFAFAGFQDTVAPIIERDGIEVWDSSGHRFTRKRDGRLIVSGDVSIVVTAYDLVNGNASYRKLGLYKLGYQILKDDGTAVAGFESPLINIEFDRLPPEDAAVTLAYAAGSGVSAYGTPTKFRYIVTNLVKNGIARPGVLRTTAIPPGPYVLKIVGEDFAGNRTSLESSHLAIEIEGK
ncbi:MAG TPA: NHL repeat-containing protein, partial [Blastocatellia bacterium]|nr:NHL repeat-containing protein [Blastocatellia bacterium]